MVLGIYPKELKTSIHTKNCTWIFIAALFIIAKTWKQPRCPSVGEWINKLWYILTMEYYSTLRRNELSSHEKTWNNLQCMSLSKGSQSESLHTCKRHTKSFAFSRMSCNVIPTTRHSGKGKTLETVKRSVVDRSWGGGRDE